MNIVVNDISKKYSGHSYALKNVNLDIEPGMFGLIGPNGAGKTTFMKILVTLMKSTSGEVTVDGMKLSNNRDKIRNIIGYLPQDFDVIPKLTTKEYLEYCYRLSPENDRKKRKSRVDELLEKVGLSDVRERQASKLSGGMKRRLGIAQALIGNPRLLVVDEPTVGLDPEERIRFRNIIADLAYDDRIIILSTHIVGDISSTCNDLAVLDRGEIVFKGTPSMLLDLARDHCWLVEMTETDYKKIKDRYHIISTIPSSGKLEVQLVAETLQGFKGKPVEPTLEHAYVYFMESIKEKVNFL